MQTAKTFWIAVILLGSLSAAGFAVETHGAAQGTQMPQSDPAAESLNRAEVESKNDLADAPVLTDFSHTFQTAEGKITVSAVNGVVTVEKVFTPNPPFGFRTDTYIYDTHKNRIVKNTVFRTSGVSVTYDCATQPRKSIRALNEMMTLIYAALGSQPVPRKSVRVDLRNSIAVLKAKRAEIREQP